MSCSFWTIGADDSGHVPQAVHGFTEGPGNTFEKILDVNRAEDLLENKVRVFCDWLPRKTTAAQLNTALENGFEFVNGLEDEADIATNVLGWGVDLVRNSGGELPRFHSLTLITFLRAIAKQ